MAEVFRNMWSKENCTQKCSGAQNHPLQVPLIANDTRSHFWRSYRGRIGKPTSDPDSAWCKGDFYVFTLHIGWKLKIPKNPVPIPMDTALLEPGAGFWGIRSFEDSLYNGAPNQLSVLDFFNYVSILEGCLVPGCSKTRQLKSNSKKWDGTYWWGCFVLLSKICSQA